MAIPVKIPLAPHLDLLQVEISSRCTAACSYCPHSLFADVWQSKPMDFALFEKLTPVLPVTGMIYLQGWGEPFTHPEFFRFARAACVPFRRIAKSIAACRPLRYVSSMTAL